MKKLMSVITVCVLLSALAGCQKSKKEEQRPVKQEPKKEQVKKDHKKSVKHDDKKKSVKKEIVCKTCGKISKSKSENDKHNKDVHGIVKKDVKKASY
ncbi:MAG: hypothetical protein WC747_00315 [Candidatus Babeliales bacterium]|jgi:hypothetical protein